MSTVNQKLYTPIFILLGWLLFTVFFFISGPYTYKLTNALFFYAFLFSIHIALLWGYKRGLQSDGRISPNVFYRTSLLNNCITIYFIYLMLRTLTSGNIGVFNIGSALNDSSETYLLSHSDENVSIFNYIDMIFAPLQTVAVVCGLYFWKNINTARKTAVILIILVIIGNSVAASVRSAMVSVILLVIAAFILKIVTKQLIITFKKKIIIGASTTLVIVMFFTYTSHLVQTRNTVIIQNPLTFEDPDPNNIYYRLLPDDWNLTITATNFYLGHSYYRLNQAMNMPFNGLGFGLSNSYFVIKNVKKITGWDGLANISYGARLDNQTGYGFFGVYWSTIYTWMASDFTFPGTVIWVFFIGYFFALSLKDTLKSPNLLSIAVFGNFFTLIYSFASVNPFQDGTAITNIGGLFLFWMILRRKQTNDQILPIHEIC